MDKKNIAGIHNYCDRWCERCPFTSRCAVYDDELEHLESGDQVKEELFFERLSENLSKAKAMIEEMVERAGIDMETFKEEMEKSEVDEKISRKKTEEHPVTRSALEYQKLATDWLKTQPGMLDKLEKMKEELTLGIESEKKAKEDMATIKDSIAVIEWYSYFIHQKVSRAIKSRFDVVDLGGLTDTIQNDFNGSAKIASIAIDNSRAAWIKLFQLLPQQEDAFISVLGVLDKLKRELTEEFPDFMKFIRPGFDEV